MKRGMFRRGCYLSYVTIYFFSFFAMASFSSVLSVYLKGIEKTATEISFIVSASGMFSFAIAPIVGYLCDRTGKPRLISSILLTGVGIMAVVFANCRQVWALFLLNGLTMSFYNSTTSVAERLISSGTYRYGVLRIWGTFGYAAGAQAAGLAIEHFPPVVLFLSVLTAALLGAVGYLWAVDPLPQQPEAQTRKEFPETKHGLSSFLKNPQFLLFLVVVFLCAGSSSVNMTYVPLRLNELGVSIDLVGTVLSISTLVEIPILLFSNKFMDRFSSKQLLLLCFSLFLLQYLCYSFAARAWTMVLVVILVKAIASTLMMMIFLKTVSNLVPEELTTTGLAASNSIINLGSIALHNLGGVLVDRTSIQTLFLCLAGLMVLGMVLALFLKVKNDRKVFG